MKKAQQPPWQQFLQQPRHLWQHPQRHLRLQQPPHLRQRLRQHLQQPRQAQQAPLR